MFVKILISTAVLRAVSAQRDHPERNCLEGKKAFRVITDPNAPDTPAAKVDLEDARDACEAEVIDEAGSNFKGGLLQLRTAAEMTAFAQYVQESMINIPGADRVWLDGSWKTQAAPDSFPEDGWYWEGHNERFYTGAADVANVFSNFAATADGTGGNTALVAKVTAAEVPSEADNEWDAVSPTSTHFVACQFCVSGTDTVSVSMTASQPLMPSVSESVPLSFTISLPTHVTSCPDGEFVSVDSKKCVATCVEANNETSNGNGRCCRLVTDAIEYSASCEPSCDNEKVFVNETMACMPITNNNTTTEEPTAVNEPTTVAVDEAPWYESTLAIVMGSILLCLILATIIALIVMCCCRNGDKYDKTVVTQVYPGGGGGGAYGGGPSGPSSPAYNNGMGLSYMQQELGGYGGSQYGNRDGMMGASTPHHSAHGPMSNNNSNNRQAQLVNLQQLI